MRLVSAVLWGVWVAAGLIGVVSLVLSIGNLPANGWWLHRFQTPEITRSRTFSQTFRMTRDGFNSIDVAVRRVASTGSGELQIALIDVTDDAQSSLVRSAIMKPAEIADRGNWRFAFSPIVDSKHRNYRVELAATDNSGIAVVATRGDRYQSGTFAINGTTRWGDLVFRTSAPVPTLWQRIWADTRRAERLPGHLLLGLLGLNWVAMAFLFRGVLLTLAPR